MPPATKQTPEERIAELEEQLSLSDQGVSKLAQRCLALEQQLAALEKHETYDNMSLFRLTLYYDYGLGFSQQDTLSAPVSAYSASNHTVSAIFEMPREVRAIRLDPGELPCYVAGIALSDQRLQAVPLSALSLDEDKSLFLSFDPQFLVECPMGLPHLGHLPDASGRGRVPRGRAHPAGDGLSDGAVQPAPRREDPARRAAHLGAGAGRAALTDT